MWKKLVIYDAAKPIELTQEKLPERRSVDFLKKVLTQSVDIPVWEFSFEGYSGEKNQIISSLMQIAMTEKHCFSVVTGYRELYRIDQHLLHHCHHVRILLDERHVPYLELSEFYEALAWAKQKSIRITVQVNLSEAMLQKVIENLLLPRLLDLVESIIFHVPKDDQRPQLSRDQFGFFLDYIAYKMLRMRVLKKIEIDACMIPALSVTPRKKFTQCAHQNTLILFTDGRVKVCPHGPVLEVVENLAQFQHVKRLFHKKRYRDLLSHCIWREDWNLQESKKRYRLR